MNKEELIELINAIKMKEVVGFTLNYRKEKPGSYYSNSEDVAVKTISFNKDIEEKMEENINYLDRRISSLDETVENLFKQSKEYTDEKVG